MKTSLTVLVLVLLLLSILAGCAPGPNPSKRIAGEHGESAGFWLGLWQGFIAPFVFVASLFKGDLNVYEVHNNGSWYNFGYLCGLACFFGGGGKRTSRRCVTATLARAQKPSERGSS
ncbi:MAG TPA: hypothetical protein VED66_05525 [Candidatus Sulfotelmatobacter sp.]|nr:hypothetical protein [Candidatus Sulfotelmatobacter sp.]